MINDDIRPLSEENPAPGGRSRWLPIRIVAAAVVIATAAVCTAACGDQSSPTAPGSAAQPSAAARPDPDQGLAPGQYLYVGSRGKGIGNSYGDVAYETESTGEIWVPANRNDEWMERRDHVRPVKIIPASEDTPERQRMADQGWFTGEWRAACGSWSYMGENADKPACRPIEGRWSRPTPEFLAALPRDPDALLAKLKEGTTPGAKISQELGAFGDAREFLDTGLVPRDLRAALHQALLRMSGIKVAENVANLDGRKGTALGFVDVLPTVPQGTHLNEIIIDPSSEQIIGTRTTMVRDMVLGEGNQTNPAVVFEKGKVMGLSSITIAVVDRIGTKPAA